MTTNTVKKIPSDTYVIHLNKIDSNMLTIAGGKGANLGELSGISGIQVPGGFCITTAAYKDITGNNKELNSLIGQLPALKIVDKKGIAEVSAKIRNMISEIRIPNNIKAEIIRYIEISDENGAYAIRSSATAEDLPTASFAGQQDTYLNIIGKDAIIEHISKCWA